MKTALSTSRSKLYIQQSKKHLNQFFHFIAGKAQRTWKNMIYLKTIKKTTIKAVLKYYFVCSNNFTILSLVVSLYPTIFLFFKSITQSSIKIKSEQGILSKNTFLPEIII